MNKKLLTILLGLSCFNLSYSQYCTTTNDGSACITNVTLNGINNSTPGCEGVDNYNQQSATTTLSRGVSYTFSLTTEEEAIASVWIDWDQDDTFEASEWQQVYLASTSGSITISVPMSAVLGTTGMRVRSRYSGNDNGSGDACGYMGSGETEDYEITVGPPPSCPQPANLQVLETTTNSADVSWTVNGAETKWQIKYGPVGFLPAAGTAMIVNVNPSVTAPTIGGLAANQFYQFYVRAICSPGDTSFYSGPKTFNTYGIGQYMEAGTQCGPGYVDISQTGINLGLEDDTEIGLTLPFPFYYQGTIVNQITVGNNGGVALNTLTTDVYYEMITPTGLSLFTQDLYTALPGGGVFRQTTGTAPNRKFIIEWHDLAHFDFAGVSTNGSTFQLVIDEATNQFYYIYEDVDMGNGVWNNGADAEIGVRGPQNIDVSLNNTNYLTQNSCAHFYYTNCPKPTNLQFSNIGLDEFGVEWEAGLASETEWTVEYGETGFTPGTGTELTNINTPFTTISDLNPLTTYDVYVYALCANGDISTGVMGSVQTLPECANPYGITGDSGADSLMVSWLWTQTVDPISGFNLQYGATGFDIYAAGSTQITGTGMNFADTILNPAFIAGMTYDVWVQAVCGSANDTSNFIGPFTVTMPLTNDLVCRAETLMTNGTVYYLSNVGATVATGEQAIAPPNTGNMESDGWGNSSISNSTWFKFTAPASGSVRISGKDVSFDGQIAVYSVGNCNTFGTFTLIGANDDDLDGMSPAPNFTVCGLTAGNTYYLMHDSYYTNETGDYSIKISAINLNAGTSGSLINLCSGASVDLFTGITGNDQGGEWIPTISSIVLENDSYFNSAGLGYITFDFQYRITDGCAYDSAVAKVKVFPPSSAGTSGSLSVCQNEPLFLAEGLTGNASFNGTWYNPQGAALPNGSIVASSTAGQYIYRYVAGNNVCPNDTATVTINVSATCNYLGMDETTLSGLNLYPNPTDGYIYISNDGSSEIYNYAVSDINGRLISTLNGQLNNSGTTVIDLNQVENGMYLIQVFNDKGSKTFRVVVK